MKKVQGLACVFAASLMGACAADVIRFDGNYTWYRTCGGVIGDPPSNLLLDITKPRDQQPSSQNTDLTFFHQLCSGFTSCGVNNQPIRGPGILRSTADVPATRCTNTIQLHLAYGPAAGELIGPAAPGGTTWEVQADQGATIGAGFQHYINPPMYLGVRIRINSQFHYGWIHLQAYTTDGMGHWGYVVDSWAYESDPNTAIVAGSPATPCECNFDGVPGVNSQDFFAYITCFFDGDCNADVNQDGTETSEDFFEFLSCFFSQPARCG